MNIHEFIDYPLLAYVDLTESKSNRMLGEVIEQSGVLFLKI
jgi:hypothetical protein